MEQAIKYMINTMLQNRDAGIELSEDKTQNQSPREFCLSLKRSFGEKYFCLEILTV